MFNKAIQSVTDLEQRLTALNGRLQQGEVLTSNEREAILDAIKTAIKELEELLETCGPHLGAQKTRIRNKITELNDGQLLIASKNAENALNRDIIQIFDSIAKSFNSIAEFLKLIPMKKLNELIYSS